MTQTKSHPAARQGGSGASRAASAELTLPSENAQRLSNRLSVLAEDVRSEAEAFAIAERASAEHALKAGRLLVEAKEACRHGEWLPFLKRAGVAERSAQRWMELHRGDLKSDTVTDLGGVVPALRFLRLRRNARRCLIDSVAAYRRDDRDEFLVLLGGWNAGVDEMLGMFPPEQVAAVEAARKADPEWADAWRDCLIFWASLQAERGAS